MGHYQCHATCCTRRSTMRLPMRTSTASPCWFSVVVRPSRVERVTALLTALSQILVVYLYRAGNSVARKSGTMPPYHDRVRGTLPWYRTCFSTVGAAGTPVALRHAALCLAKRVCQRGAEAIQASTAAQALQRPEAVSWPHPQASLCRL